MKRFALSRNGIGAMPLILALIVVLAGLLLIYRNWQQEREVTKVEPGMAAWPSGSRTLHRSPSRTRTGTSTPPPSSPGKPVAINFFRDLVPPCREEIPGFVEVYKKTQGKGFELIGISLDTDTREEHAGS